MEAAQCAIEIQRTLAHRDADAPAERQIQVRIGVHIGDVVHRGGDVYGDGVNIASRIEPVAGPGGICVSMDVERQIRNALEARFEKLAPTDLKNISVPMDLFRIVLPWERDNRPRAESEKTSLPPPEKDAILGSGNLAGLAEIEAQTGAAAEAVENLRKLLSIPAGETISIARVKVDPVWNPIRHDPGFQKLITGTEHVGP